MEKLFNKSGKLKGLILVVCTLLSTVSYGQFSTEQDTTTNVAPQPEETTMAVVTVADSIPEVPDELIADRLKCLEKNVQLTFNKKIRGFIDYFTVRNRRYPLVMERRKHLYFEIFEEALRRHNMPQELKYLAIVESGLNPKAISRAGAAGLWQFMPSTGKIYKLKQDQYVDERLDPYKSTEAACRYLKDLYKIFNDWELALASYNCGPGNVRKAIRKSGYKDTFWEIYNFLPQETRGYVPQFVALTYTMNHLQDHNIFADSLEYPIRFDTVHINQFVNLDMFCEQLNICKDEFTKMNPAIKKNYLPDNYSFHIRIPSDKSEYFAMNKLAILDESSKRSGDEIDDEIAQPPVQLASTKSSSENKSHGSATAQKKKVYYTVKKGDVLSKIADKYEVSLSDLKKWNNLKGSTIKSGQKLTIYKGGLLMEKPTLAKQSESSKKYVPHKKVYYVQPGDTLWTISKSNNIPVEKLKKLNNLKSNAIKVGQKLIMS
jgi:membrane-bound lytic murein transglycosylase D